MPITKRERELLNAAARPTLDKLAELAEATSDKVSALLVAIQAHYYDKDVKVYKLCRQAEATDWHMTLFRRELGLSPRALIRECRMETAMRLLRDTPLTIPRIAKLVGYTDRSLQLLCEALRDMPPSDLRDWLRRVDRQLRDLVDGLFSWYFRVRYHRGEIESAELDHALSYLKDRQGHS